MKIRWKPARAAAAAAALIFLAAGAQAAGPRRADTAGARFERGMAVLVYGNYPQTRARARAMMGRLRRLHVSHVRIVFPVRQDGLRSSRVYRDRTDTPTDRRLRAIASEARRRRMKVSLVPLIDEGRFADGWRGEIEPDDVPAWFESYGALIRRYAKLAKRTRARTLSVGVELESMMRYGNEWRKLIRVTRAVYRGKLSYGVNWSGVASGWSGVSEGRYPSWLERVDTIGIDAYFPLDADAGATVADLRAALGEWSDELAEFKDAYRGKPIVLTEVGIRSQRDAFREPWAWHHGTPMDLDAQRRYYAAYCGWAKENRLSGLHWWFVGIDVPRRKKVRDRGFNPLGKPAERQVRRCFADGAA